ncbi:hypothetical protein [Streptomyces sp. NPDC001843]|uniref:hypothetical protein n=1 Tax=Streptomyces sp. NPDC001843 TaxID=3364617 RepID=UPI0036BFA5BF
MTRAIGRLESWHMIQRVDSGLISVNPMHGFEGNGDVQREILDALRDKETGSAAAASVAVMPVARRRTEQRPTFAQSTGRRGAAAPGARTRRRRRERGTGVLTRASQSSRKRWRISGRRVVGATAVDRFCRSR